MVTVKIATKSAETLVEEYEADPKVAVGLAYTFVHWRIKTLVMRYLKYKSKEVSLVDGRTDFAVDLKIAYGLDLIDRNEFR